MKKAAAIILAMAMIFALCGCHDIYDKDEDAPVPEFAVCVDFSRVETDGFVDEASDELVFAQSICVPEIISAGSDKAAEKINLDIAYQYELFDEGADTIRNAALSIADEKAAAELESAEASDESEGLVFNTFMYEETAELNRGDVGVISLSYDVYTYSGGAHGYVSRTSASYDASTGEKLTLESISDEPELLEQLVYGYVLNISAGEKYKNEAGESIFFNPDLTESISDLIGSGNWFFSNEGLVFFANPYELAPFSCGRIDFTVPYAAMDGLLKEEYLPVQLEGDNGMMLAENGDSKDMSGLTVLNTVTLDEKGQSVIISAQETVYNVQIMTDNSAEAYNPGRNLLWYRSYMTTDEALELVSFIPDTAPNVILSYTLADGTVVERGVYQSGKDGSIILTELG